MILRRSILRHGRQLMSAPVGRSCTARALTTDGRQPPLPTELADPAPPPPAEDVASATTQKPGPESLRSRLARRAGQQPGQTSPTALFTRHKKVEADEGIADNYQIQQGIAKTTGGMGSVLHERFDPSSLLRDPPRPEDVTLELLMASQTHMGHHTSLWNPANQRYIYGVRDNIHIISLEETAAALRRAARVVEEVAYLGGLILFVGNRRGQMEVVARAAELAGACHLFTKWVPGTITNRDQILGREPMRVVDERDKTLQGFDRLLIEKRPLLPDLVVVLNPLENFVMLHECAQETIPTIGLIDTDADPTRVTYTIPGNDDSLRSVSVIAGVLGRAGEKGQKRRLADAKTGICTWSNPPDIDKWLREKEARETAEKSGGEDGEAVDEVREGDEEKHERFVDGFGGKF